MAGLRGEKREIGKFGDFEPSFMILKDLRAKNSRFFGFFWIF
jgi:hypothetical protein